MQPNTQFLILQKKYQINLAQTQFSGPGRFRPGPFNHRLPLPGLQAQKPGPGPGKWPPPPACYGPSGAQRAQAGIKGRSVAPRASPKAHFFPPSLSLYPTARRRRRGERQRRRRALLAGGACGDGRTQLRRASLVGALSTRRSRARDLSKIHGGDGELRHGDDYLGDSRRTRKGPSLRGGS